MKKLLIGLALVSSSFAQEPLQNLGLTANYYPSIEQPVCCYYCTNHNFFVFADFLYWKPYTSVPLVVTGDNVTLFGPGSGYTSLKQDITMMDFEFVPAFRAGVEADLPRDDWKFVFYWTSLHTHKSDSLRATTDSDLNIFWGGTLLSSPTRVNTRSKLHYNVADLELRNNFSLSECVSFAPSIGLRLAWIKQRAKLEYLDYTPHPSTPTLFADSNIRLQNDFFGTGLRAAFAPSWTVGKGWEFYATAGASLLYGKVETLMQDHVTGATGLDVTVKNDNDYHGIKSELDLLVGLKWEKTFCRYAIRFHVAYEMTNWINQWALREYFYEPFYVATTVDNMMMTVTSDLTLQGLNTGLSLSF